MSTTSGPTDSQEDSQAAEERQQREEQKKQRAADSEKPPTLDHLDHLNPLIVFADPTSSVLLTQEALNHRHSLYEAAENEAASALDFGCQS